MTQADITRANVPQGGTPADPARADLTGNDKTGNDRTGNDRTGNDRTGNDRTGNGATPVDGQPSGRRRLSLRGPDHVAAGNPWPLSRMFRVGAVLAAVVVTVLLATGGTALWRLTETRSAAAAVGVPGVLAGQQLVNAMVNEETGVRGFAQTGQPEFLEPYSAGRDDEQQAVARLTELLPLQLRDYAPALLSVQQAAQAWRSGYAQPIIDRSPNPPTPEQGKALFDRVRAELAGLNAELADQRAAATASVNAAAGFLTVASLVIAAVLVAFVVAVGIGLRRAVLAPVSALTDQVREVVSGRVHQDVRVAGPSEIVELGADVNAMRVRILTDLEQVKATNEQLDRQASDLERSNRDLEQFAYVASHDLQEPLRKVSSFCQLLQRRYGGKLDERADQYIEFAVDGAQRMQQLINDLLTFSRVGRSAASFVPVDLGAVTAVAQHQLETVRAEAGGRIEVGTLPTVSGDQALLRQLMINLLGNALKFRRAGAPPVVRVQAVREDDGWLIEIVDNGIGIEAEYADKVFVIFQRLHGRDSYPGTGIGLALAKKIVEFHGGRIGLAPSTGTGTTVQFTLPVLEEET